MTRPQYKATPDTLEDGQFSTLRVDSTGALVVADGVAVTSIGSPDDAAWDDVAAEATVISLLKAIAINTATP